MPEVMIHVQLYQGRLHVCRGGQQLWRNGETHLTHLSKWKNAVESGSVSSIGSSGDAGHTVQHQWMNAQSHFEDGRSEALPGRGDGNSEQSLSSKVPLGCPSIVKVRQVQCVDPRAGEPRAVRGGEWLAPESRGELWTSKVGIRERPGANVY